MDRGEYQPHFAIAVHAEEQLVHLGFIIETHGVLGVQCSHGDGVHPASFGIRSNPQGCDLTLEQLDSARRQLAHCRSMEVAGNVILGARIAEGDFWAEVRMQNSDALWWVGIGRAAFCLGTGDVDNIVQAMTGFSEQVHSEGWKSFEERSMPREPVPRVFQDMDIEI